ncbi:MAG: nitroreductase family protein [Chloroflexia bacterium]
MNGKGGKGMISFLKGLKAIREFKPDPLPDEVLADVLEVGRWSGSAKNVQPWEFIVVRDRDTLSTLSELKGYAKHLKGAALAVVLVMEGENDEGETYDEGRVSERMMLAAAAHGVGSSIGWFTPEDRPRAKEILGAPQERTLRTAISFGYPTEQALRPRQAPGQARKPLAEIVHEERYT